MNYLNNEEKEIEVFVSVTLSKSVKIKVSDYKNYGIAKDENGDKYEDIDFSECDLNRAVKEQIIMPQDAYIYLGDYARESGFKSVPEVNHLKDWNVDEFEVILE